MFQTEFPILKLDFISARIPFVANENVGIISLNENFFSNYSVEDFQFYQRIRTVFHELSHAIFGYLVSVQNLESIFLVEGFTEFICQKILLDYSGVKKWMEKYN